jgi:CTP:molybdopterin cytidylyltransferase MocA
MGTPKALVNVRGKSFLAHLLEAAQHPQIGLLRVVLGSGEAEIRRALDLPDEIVVLNPDWQRGQLSSIQAAIRALAPAALTQPAPDAGSRASDVLTQAALHSDALTEAALDAGSPGERALAGSVIAAGSRSSDALTEAALHSDALGRDALDGILLCPVDHPLVTRALVAALVATFYSAARPPIVVPTFRSRRGHHVIFARSLFPALLVAPPDEGARAVVWAHAAAVAEVPTEEEGVVLNLDDPDALRRAQEIA